MRKFIGITLFLGLLSWPALAADYPKAEVFGGYQYTRLEGGVNGNGWNVAVTGNLSDWLGITADFAGAYTSESGVSFRNYTYTFGPVMSLRENRGFTPFVHALLGGDHATAAFGGASGSGNGFALLAGGGVDLNFRPHLAIRAFQADWMLVHGSGSTSSKNARISTGVVFKF